MNKRVTFPLLVTIVMSGILLTGCAGPQQESSEVETVVNPRFGWVEVFSTEDPWGESNKTMLKRCDGSVLVYIVSSPYTEVSDSISVIADSPECVS